MKSQPTNVRQFTLSCASRTHIISLRNRATGLKTAEPYQVPRPTRESSHSSKRKGKADSWLHFYFILARPVRRNGSRMRSRNAVHANFVAAESAGAYRKVSKPPTLDKGRISLRRCRTTTKRAISHDDSGWFGLARQKVGQMSGKSPTAPGTDWLTGKDLILRFSSPLNARLQRQTRALCTELN